MGRSGGRVAGRRRNGRAAGKRFEQEIARDLRRWLGDEWTVARNQTDRQQGQVEGCWGEFTIEGPGVFPFAIECKDRQEFEERHLFADGQTVAFNGYWQQACVQADGMGGWPMLILKSVGSGRPRLVVIPSVLALAVCGKDESMSPIMMLQCGGVNLTVMRWDRFLELDAGAVMLACIPPRGHPKRKTPPPRPQKKRKKTPPLRRRA